jgi:glycosyltransferase involved in cell wall biosynthesis
VPEVLPAIQAPYLVPLGGERVTVALTEALERLLREPDDRAALGRANRARVAEEYGAAAMHARYRELYRGLLPQDREA